MAIDLPKFLRAEAQRAELFAELVKRADRLNNLEMDIVDADGNLATWISEWTAVLKIQVFEVRDSVAGGMLIGFEAYRAELFYQYARARAAERRELG